MAIYLIILLVSHHMRPGCEYLDDNCSVMAYLRLDQDEVDEQHDKIMLDVFVSEPLASWTLCQPDALSQGAIVGFAVGSVERPQRISALNAYRHSGCEKVSCGGRLSYRTLEMRGSRVAAFGMESRVAGWY